jgi:tetratricopeptide (TPR) repeat protein
VSEVAEHATAIARDFKRAFAHLSDGNADAAAAACREGLANFPDSIDLLTLLGASLNAQRLADSALEPLHRALRLAPGFARAHEETGRSLLILKRLDEAISCFEEALALDPASASAERRLAQALLLAGRDEEADRVLEQGFTRSPERKRLLAAALHQRAGRFRESEPLLREVLAVDADDVNALRMLARVAEKAGHLDEAERLLRRAIELKPRFDEARLHLARVLNDNDRLADAVDCAAEVTRVSPRNSLAHYLHGGLLAQLRRHEDAIAAYRESIHLRTDNPAAWEGLGHVLKALGRQEEGIAAYREALRLRPGLGEVWWSLANLKTFRFNDDDLAAMEQGLSDAGEHNENRVHFLFALGKALEDRGEFSAAFARYDEANRIQRMRLSYDPVDTQFKHERIRATFSADFLAARTTPADDEVIPIFIVGLPRSGSTLLEQILASHPMVDGTAELPDLARVIAEISRRQADLRYPEAVARLNNSELRELGKMYLQRTRRHRSGRPFFTDKMPNNFSSVGLIHLILPQARIIDARRHPLGSLLGCYKQHFALGQSFTYDLEELGEFYLEYRRLMDHWHAALPGRVLEVRYEDMVREQEAMTRRLLEYCGLPWDPRCLQFHETERAVHTASSAQVRLPLYDSSVDHWKNFREQLAPLREVIGPAIEAEGWYCS